MRQKTLPKHCFAAKARKSFLGKVHDATSWRSRDGNGSRVISMKQLSACIFQNWFKDPQYGLQHQHIHQKQVHEINKFVKEIKSSWSITYFGNLIIKVIIWVYWYIIFQHIDWILWFFICLSIIIHQFLKRCNLEPTIYINNLGEHSYLGTSGSFDYDIRYSITNIGSSGSISLSNLGKKRLANS